MKRRDILLGAGAALAAGGTAWFARSQPEALTQSEFVPLPPSLNTLFRRIFALERGIVRRCGARGMPFGLSILAVGRR